MTIKTLGQEVMQAPSYQRKPLITGKMNSTDKKLIIFSMGAKTNAENRKLNVPGAGSYNLPSRLVESPGKTMGKRIDIVELGGKLGPGPGGYNVDKAKQGNVAFS